MKARLLAALCTTLMISLFWIVTAAGQSDISVSDASATFTTGFGRPATEFITALQRVAKRVSADYGNATIVKELVDASTEMRRALSKVTPHVFPNYASASRSATLSFPKDLVNDQVAPQLDGTITVLPGSANSVTLRWQINEFAKSTLEYGTTPGNYSQSITIDSYETTSSVEVTNLSPNTTYFGRITLTDRSDNQGQSAEFTFSLDVTPGKPLVLIYAVLDNNLGDDTEQWQRLVTNVERGAANSNITVRLLIDSPGENNAYVYELTGGTPCIASNKDDPTCDGRYVENSNFWKVSEDTAHPESIFDFAQKALSAHLDAPKIMLSLVGHGSGWTANALPSQPSSWGEQPSRSGPTEEHIGGLLWDDTTGGSSSGTRALSTKALGIALEWLNGATGRKIDLLYLDACSMGMAEVADEIAPYVDYLLASPNTAWASFAYDAMLAATSVNMDGKAIGQAWLNAEKQALTSREPGYPYTLALYQLKQIDALATAVSALVTELNNAATSQRSAIKDAIDAAERYESNYDGKINSADQYVDLDSFLQEVQNRITSIPSLTMSIGTVRNAITGVTGGEFGFANGEPYPFPGQQWTWQNAKGIAIYLPQANDAKRSLYTSDNLRWVQRSGWDQFLDKLGLVVAADASSATLPTCASTRSCSVKLAAPLPLKTEIFLPIVKR